MNDTITVPTNGNCVSTIVKTSAGSRGARLLQISRLFLTGGASFTAGPCCTGPVFCRARVCDIVAMSDLQCFRWKGARQLTASEPPRTLACTVGLLVLVSDFLSQLLSLGQCGLDSGRACDRSGDLFRDRRSQGDELRHTHELHAGVRPRLDAGVVRIDAGDRLASRLIERCALLEGGVVERRLALAVG